MSATTFPVSGSFGGRASKPARRPAATRRAVAPQAQAAKRPWLNFLGDALTTWATAGRLPTGQ